MIRLRTILRVNPGAWLAVPIILLAILYLVSYSRYRDPYVLGITAYATSPLGFIVPICAALGAWEGGRLRRADWWLLPHVRSPVTVAMVHVAPIIVAGTAAIMAGALVSLLRVGLLVPDPRPLIVVGAVIAGHSLAGFALGLRLPLALGATAALLASFVWMVFVRAFEPLWVNHLTGASIALCCGVAEDLADQIVLGPTLVGIAIAVGALLWATRDRPSAAASIGALTPVVAGMLVGAALVSGFGTYPVKPRDIGLLVCTDSTSEPVVCLWPEHLSRSNEITAIAVDAASGWRAHGIQVPRTFSEVDPARADGDTLTFGISLLSPPEIILNDMARAMVPPWPACADVGPFPGFEAMEYVQAWYASAAGLSDNDLESLYRDLAATGAPPVVTIIEQLQRLPEGTRRAWLERNEAAIRDCGLEPQLEPTA